MKEIELRNVKGCADYSPREQYIRNYISDTLKKVYANDEKIPFVFILGEDELANNCITVKNMQEKTQVQISTINIIEEFNKIVDK